MPYSSTKDLPDRVKENLPAHAEEIYKEAFNSAYEQYDTPEERRGDDTREETAHKVAWAAVKKVYHKDPYSGKWERKTK